jgi:hypothetical protein
MKLYMLRTVPLSIIRNFSLYTQQWYVSYMFVDSFRAGSGWNILILLLTKSEFTWVADYITRTLCITRTGVVCTGTDSVPIVQKAGRSTGSCWMGPENLAFTAVRSSDRPARSQSLYRLRYPDRLLKENTGKEFCNSLRICNKNK